MSQTVPNPSDEMTPEARQLSTTELSTCAKCGRTSEEWVSYSHQYGGDLCWGCYHERGATAIAPDDLQVLLDEHSGSNGYKVSDETTSWAPADLAPILDGDEDLNPPPTMLTREDGEQLLYAGKIHSIAGEPESGKGWLALHCVGERLAAGEHVMYVDFEDEAHTVVGRLLALGVEPALIQSHFHYVRPDEPLSDVGRAEIEHVLITHSPTLAVIDGLTDALAIHGVDLRDNTEVAN